MASINNLYPPIVDTYMPAFVKRTGVAAPLFTVNFTISDFTDMTLIKEIQIIMKDQIGNKNIFKNAGYYFVPVEDIEEWDVNKRSYSIPIPISAVNTNLLTVDNYYRIQMRFSTSSVLGKNMTNEQSKRAYLDTYVDSFSEWSNISLIKVIPQNTISFTRSNFGRGTQSCSLSSLPNLSGELTFNSDTNEYLYSYRVKVFEFNENESIPSPSRLSEGLYDEKNLIEDSQTIVNSIQNQNTFNYVFTSSFNMKKKYYLLFNYETSNRYVGSLGQQFSIVRGTTSDFLNSSILYFDGYSNSEKGCNILNIVFRDNLRFSGTLVIQRASSKDNYNSWRDIDIKHFSEIKNYCFEDYSAESGVFYKYLVRQQNNEGDRGAPIYLGCKYIKQEKINNDNKTLILELEDSFLGNQEGNLKLQYNVTVDSLQENIKDNVITTLGSKFPFIFRGGKSRYKTFNLSGLIAYEMDEYERDRDFTDANSSVMIHQPAIEKEFYWHEGKDDNDISEEFFKYYYTQDKEEKVVFINNENLVFNIGRIRSEVEDLFGDDYSLLFQEDFPNQEDEEDTSNPVYLTRKIVEQEKEIQISNMTPFHVFADKIKVFDNYENIVNEYREYKQKVNIPDHYDYTLERFYREKVLNFLNDGNAKLFRSASEGNILVRLTDVTLSPFDGTQRLVWTFSATATEIDDADTLKLSQHNVIDNNIFKMLNNGEYTPDGYYTQTGEKILSIKTRSRIFGQCRFDRLDFDKNGSVDVAAHLRRKYDKVLNNIQTSIDYIPYIRVDFKQYSTGDIYGTNNGTIKIKVNNKEIYLSQSNPYLEIDNVDITQLSIHKQNNSGEGYVIIDYIVELLNIPYVYEDKSRTYYSNQVGEIRYLKEDMYTETAYTLGDGNSAYVCTLNNDFDFFQALLDKYKVNFDLISTKMKTLKKVIFRTFSLEKSNKHNVDMIRQPVPKAIFSICDYNDIKPSSDDEEKTNRFYYTTDKDGYLELYDETVPSINNIEFSGVLGTSTKTINGANAIANKVKLDFNEVSDYYKVDFNTLSLFLENLDDLPSGYTSSLRISLYTEPKQWSISRVLKYSIDSKSYFLNIDTTPEEKYLTISVRANGSGTFNFSLNSDAEIDILNDFQTDGVPYLDNFGQENWDEGHLFNNIEDMVVNDNPKEGHVYRVGTLTAKEDFFVQNGLNEDRKLVVNTDKITDAISQWQRNSVNISSDYYSCENLFTCKISDDLALTNVTLAFYDSFKYSNDDTRKYNIQFKRSGVKDSWRAYSSTKYNERWVWDSITQKYYLGLGTSRNNFFELLFLESTLGEHCQAVGPDKTTFAFDNSAFPELENGYFRILITNSISATTLKENPLNLTLYRKNFTYYYAVKDSVLRLTPKNEMITTPSLEIDENGRIYTYNGEGENPKELSKDDIFTIQFDKNKNLYYYYNNKYYRCRYIPIYGQDENGKEYNSEMLAIEMPIDINFTYFYEHYRKEAFQ